MWSCGAAPWKSTSPGSGLSPISQGVTTDAGASPWRTAFSTRRDSSRSSSPIFADEVRDTGWDYIALGHQHVPTNVSQGSVAAYYAGAPLMEWGGGHPEGTVLRIDFSAEDGIRVQPRPLD